jgi:hypothetical protein
MNAGTDQADLTSGNACWETPPAIFAALNHEFGPFDVDLTADAQRHLCAAWFGPDGTRPDALTAAWYAYGWKGYSNPPYGPFVQRLLPCAKLQAHQHNFETTLLLPMRVTKAFRAHVLKGASHLLFCDARITFFEHGVPRLNEKNYHAGRLVGDPAMFDSVVVRYVPGHPIDAPPVVSLWHVPDHVSQNDLTRAAEQRRTR